jgi:hypothetical protein
VVQRRTMSPTDMGIVGATTDSFILFENGVRRNRLVFAWVVKCGGSRFCLRSLSYGGQVAYPPFCNGLRLVNPLFAPSIRRSLASVRGRCKTAT